MIEMRYILIVALAVLLLVGMASATFNQSMIVQTPWPNWTANNENIRQTELPHVINVVHKVVPNTVTNEFSCNLGTIEFNAPMALTQFYLPLGNFAMALPGTDDSNFYDRRVLIVDLSKMDSSISEATYANWNVLDNTTTYQNSIHQTKTVDGHDVFIVTCYRNGVVDGQYAYLDYQKEGYDMVIHPGPNSWSTYYFDDQPQNFRKIIESIHEIK